MTTVTLTSTESRHQKALALLADRGQWLTVQARDGRIFIGVPSDTKRGLVHLVLADGSECDCYDFRNHGRGQACKHALAVRLYNIQRGTAPEPQPAADTLDGLNAMLEQRLTERQAELAKAAEYERIFARFERED